MMTSSYMALHADDFEPFLEMPLDEYRQSRIDPATQEIDQIGLTGLTTGVIAPAGVGLEVLYLDRSVGDMVTPHPFVHDAENKPSIRLLYRP
jgi:ubiquitin thioesterase protein OTUB1